MTGFGRRVLDRCDAWMDDHPWDHNRGILRQVPDRVDRTLDVGCATGDFARRLAGVAGHVDAVDRDERVVAIARERTRDRSVHHLVADLDDPALEPAHDVGLSLLAVPVNLAVGWVTNLRRRRVVAPVPTAPAVSTLAEIRAAAERQTYGARIRRHLFWRCPLVFTS